MSGTNIASATPAGASSYQKRRIDLTLTLGEGSFGGGGVNTVKLSGLRIVATIEKSGFPSMDKAVVRVYGVQPSVMNTVSTLGIPLQMWRQGNAMLIEAGDDANGMSTVYAGYMQQAYQSFDEAPETFLQLVGWGGQNKAIFPAQPISFAGSADVATMLSGIAQREGWGIEKNSSVNVHLSNPYFAGTAWEQAQAIGRAANIEVYLDSGASPPTLAYWPKYGTRGGLVPLVKAGTGLVGYPRFQSSGMTFRCIFNPNMRLGGQIVMQSTVGGAAQDVPNPAANGVPAGTQTGGPNGTWTIIAPLVHNLAAEVPGGPWFTEVACQRVNGPGSAR